MTPTDRDAAGEFDTIVATMVERIVDRFAPERTLLFGSRARADATEWSDVDLLVVMPDGTDRREAAVEIGVALGNLPAAKDIVVTTPCPDRTARPRHRYGAAGGTERGQGALRAGPRPRRRRAAGPASIRSAGEGGSLCQRDRVACGPGTSTSTNSNLIESTGTESPNSLQELSTSSW